MNGLILDVDGVIAVTNSAPAEKLSQADRIVASLQEVRLEEASVLAEL